MKEDNLMRKHNMEMKEHNRKSKFFRRYLTKMAIIVIVIVLVVGAGIIGYKRFASSESKTIKIGFENIGELATQSAYCTEINTTDDSRKMFGVTIPFTQSKYIYSYNVVIKAGFDFGEIEWSVKDNTIEVKLPESKILSNEIDMNSFEIYQESESIFNQITMTENNEAIKNLQHTAEENAITNGLFKNARSNAETILTSFFGNVYDLKVYKISFTDK